MNSKFSDPHSAGEKQTGEKQVSQPGRVLHGLYNQGATSYLNCVLQVLFMTKEIHDRLTETETDHVLRKLFNDLQNKTCRTETITQCLGIDDVNEQRDAADCLMQILRCISEGASGVFQGRMRFITTCCQKHSIHWDTNNFWIFPLSLKHGPDRTYCVEKSFQDFFKPETFTGNNKLLCTRCREKTEAETQTHVCKSPPILTLLLKAFDFDDRSDAMSKCPVKVPHSLKIKNKVYELYGIVDHTGSLRAGHYTATILSSEDNMWYQFNDEHVSKVHEQPFVHDGYYNSQNAYLLMYRALTSNSCQIYKVIVNGQWGEMIIGLGNTVEQMQKMTVLQLKEKIIERVSDNYDVKDLRLIFTGKVLDEDSTLLSSYGIQHQSVLHLMIKSVGGGWSPPPQRPPRRRSLEWFLSF